MTSAIPVHSYHPPRHPHAITPTSPTSNPACYYTTTASSSSTQHTSYWPAGHCSSVSTASSSSPRLSAGLAAAQFVTGRLHKRSRSGNKTPDELPDEMFDEGFFSGPGSPPPAELGFKKAIKSKNKIKPLLKKVSGGSRGNSLDLSRSDGGIPGGVGVGLGIYDTNGYESSGVDDDLLETAFPRCRPKRHTRTGSTLSVHTVSSPLVTSSATPTQPFSHPKRQVPRRGAYTPDMSLDATSNESASEESQDERETRRIVLAGSGRNSSVAGAGPLTINTTYDGTATPILVTHGYSSARTPSLLTSPVESPKIKSRGRLAVKDGNKTPREPSPGFAASVTAARLAWEAKEEKKEAKRESKRRRSEAKEGERHTNSQNSNNGRTSISGAVWEVDAEGEVREKDTPFPAPEETDEDVVYLGRGSTEAAEAEAARGRNATGKKWGVLADQMDGRKRGGKRLGLKKRWLGFIVWVRIGMVRLGRKMGFSSPT